MRTRGADSESTCVRLSGVLIPAPASISVKVFLLPLDRNQSFFYSEDDSVGPDALPLRSGLGGWVLRQSADRKSIFQTPPPKAGQAVTLRDGQPTVNTSGVLQKATSVLTY